MKYLRFLKAWIKWAFSGFLRRSPANIAAIYDNICVPCPHFTGKECDICGCLIKREAVTLNKLTWLSESCPDKPPRWVGVGWIYKLSQWLHF